MARPKAFDEDITLGKAIDLFWCQGYEATSMQQLVDGLGINRASLYDTYGDKYTLYVKALERYRQSSLTSLCTLLDQPRSARALLTDLLDNVLREILDDPDHKGCFMVNSAIELAPHNPDIAKIVSANQRLFEDRLQAVIARGQADNDISHRHPAADLARFVFNTINGLKVVGRSNPDEAALRSVVAVAMATLTP